MWRVWNGTRQQGFAPLILVVILGIVPATIWLVHDVDGERQTRLFGDSLHRTDVEFRAFVHFQGGVRKEWIYAPFNTGQKVRQSIAIQIACPGMGTMGGDFDRLAIATHCARRIEKRLRCRAHIPKQINAPLFG